MALADDAHHEHERQGGDRQREIGDGKHEEVPERVATPPTYFPFNVLMNIKGGIPSIDDVIKRGTKALSPEEFQLVWEAQEALVIDTRSKDIFPQGFLPGSVFIGLDDNFAPWVGTLITDLQQPVLLVTDEGHEEEAVVRMSRVGYDNSVGCLKGGVKAWKEAGYAIDTLTEVTAEEFEKLYDANKNIHLLDARKESEYMSQHIQGAENFPLDFINQNMSILDKNKQYYLHCAGGYRSLITASILKARGYNNIINIKGGFKALSATNLPKTTYSEQKTML